MSANKRGRSVITDSDSDNEQKSIKKKEKTPVLRSSERIRKKNSRQFRLPSKEEIWNDIPSTEIPFKSQDMIKPRKLANEYSRVTHRYNQDEFDQYLTDNSSLDDFIDDSSDDKSEVSIESERSSSENGNKTLVKTKVSKTRTTGDMDQESDSFSDDEVQTKGSAKKKIIESDSSSDSEPYRITSRKHITSMSSADDNRELQDDVKVTKRVHRRSIVHSDSSESIQSNDHIPNKNSAESQSYLGDIECNSLSPSKNVLHTVVSDSVGDVPGTSSKSRKTPKKPITHSDESGGEDHIEDKRTESISNEDLQAVGGKKFNEDSLQELDKGQTENVIGNQNSSVVKTPTGVASLQTKSITQGGVGTLIDGLSEKNGTAGRASSPSGSSTDNSDTDDTYSSSDEEHDCNRHTKHVRRQAKQLNDKKKNFQAFLEARKKISASKKW